MRLNQLILREISSECSLEGLNLKLKLQYLTTWWEELTVEKTLMLGKVEGRKRRGQQRMWWLDAITDSIDMSLSKLWVLVMDRDACHAAVHGVTKRHDWAAELNWNFGGSYFFMLFYMENNFLWIILSIKNINLISLRREAAALGLCKND